MGYFDFLSPGLGDVPDDEATNQEAQDAERMSQAGNDLERKRKRLASSNEVGGKLDELIKSGADAGLDSPASGKVAMLPYDQYSGKTSSTDTGDMDKQADDEVFRDVISKLPEEKRQAAIDKYFSMVREDSGLHGDIDANLKAYGKSPQMLRIAMIGGAKAIEQTYGIGTDNLRGQVPFQGALITALGMFDSQGNILKMLANDLSSTEHPREQKKSGSKDGEQQQQEQPDQQDPSLVRMRQMQLERRQLYAQLGQTPELQNWLGVLTFVFLAIAARSPAVAASILGISARQGRLKGQLDVIEKEMHEEANILRDNNHRRDMIRRIAAEHSLRQGDKEDDFQRDLQKMYLNNRLILQRETARHPEQAGAFKALERSFTRYNTLMGAEKHEMDKAESVLKDPFQTDKAMKSKAKIDYENARSRYEGFKQRLLDLNGQIEKFGQTPALPENEAPEDR